MMIPKKAFWDGFWRGLAAPVAVFSDHNTPLVFDEPQFVEVHNPATDSEGIAGDFRRVGDSIRVA